MGSGYCPPQRMMPPPQRYMPRPRPCPPGYRSGGSIYPPGYGGYRRPSVNDGFSWGGGQNARVTIPRHGSGAVYIR
jgi:hypothetical protein